MIKIIDDLRQPDFVGHPVWRYVRYDSRMVEPVAQIPVADLEECIVGTLVSLANGSRHFAMVSNIDAHRPERNAHFIGLTFFRDDKRFFPSSLPRCGLRQPWPRCTGCISWLDCV